MSLPSRTSVLVSLAGVVLSMLGFFLPMFIESNPQVPGSAHAVYEWQVVASLSMGVWLVFFALLPLLCMLIILVTGVVALFRELSPKVVWLRCLAIGWGLLMQLTFAIFVFQVLLIGYERTDLSWGFIIVLVGFIVMSGSIVRLQTTFTPLACILLVVGSIILAAGWLVTEKPFSMLLIVFILLPVLFLFGVFALLMVREWLAAALTLPLIMATLYMLYFLTGFIIYIPMPGAQLVAFIVSLLLLNGGAFWLMRGCVEGRPGK